MQRALHCEDVSLLSRNSVIIVDGLDTIVIIVMVGEESRCSSQALRSTFPRRRDEIYTVVSLTTTQTLLCAVWTLEEQT